MRYTRWQGLVSAVVLSLGLSFAGEASACPNCKEAVSAQPAEVANMARGYNLSIMLMIGMPVTLLGTGAFMIRRAIRHGTLPEF